MWVNACDYIINIGNYPDETPACKSMGYSFHTFN